MGLFIVYLFSAKWRLPKPGHNTIPRVLFPILKVVRVAVRSYLFSLIAIFLSKGFKASKDWSAHEQVNYQIL